MVLTWLASALLPLLPCTVADEAMLALPLEQFDQTQAGWRSIDQDGCEATAADAIARYREVNAAVLEGQSTSTLLWHEGQLRAAAGQNERAIPLMLQRRDEGTEADQVYVDATVAFLLRDLAALVAARERLASLPEPAGFAAAVERYRTSYPQYPPPTWPPNLDVVDGLLTCFDLPYREAYGCRPSRD